MEDIGNYVFNFVILVAAIASIPADIVVILTYVESKGPPRIPLWFKPIWDFWGRVRRFRWYIITATVFFVLGVLFSALFNPAPNNPMPNPTPIVTASVSTVTASSIPFQLSLTSTPTQITESTSTYTPTTTMIPSTNTAIPPTETPSPSATLGPPTPTLPPPPGLDQRVPLREDGVYITLKSSYKGNGGERQTGFSNRCINRTQMMYWIFKIENTSNAPYTAIVDRSSIRQIDSMGNSQELVGEDACDHGLGDGFSVPTTADPGGSEFRGFIAFHAPDRPPLTISPSAKYLELSFILSGTPLIFRYPLR